MSKSIADLAYENSTLLLRDKNQTTNNKLSEKTEKFIFKSSDQSFEKQVVFDGMNGQLFELYLTVDTENAGNIKLSLNDVQIKNKTFSGDLNLYYCGKLNSLNTLKISANFSGNYLYKITIILKGNINLSQKNNIKFDFKQNEFLFFNSDFISKSSTLMSNNIYNNDINSIVFDKILDCRYNFENSTNDKNNMVLIYNQNDDTYLTDLTANLTAVLDFDFTHIALLPSSNSTIRYVVLYVFGGKVHVVKYDSSMTKISDVVLTLFDNLKISKITACVGLQCNYRFLACTVDGLTYYCSINLNDDSVNVKLVGKYKYPISFSDNLDLIIIDRGENEVKIDTYSITSSVIQKQNSSDYLNVDNAIYYNGDYYFIVDDDIKLVE